ncbi:MAG TPA: guanylate kinase [Epulopiscium sp.]|nr:guanylate kinase [Candidatus Epulonipiscium sp.]
MIKEGLKIIISGPSGSGKGTIVRELIKNPQSIISVSATTREPRPGEVHGEHYFFTTQKEFKKMIEEKQLLEYAEFCGNYYGTPKAFVDETTKSGKNIILEIEVEGALQVKAMYPEAIFIFVIPPSLVALKDRLVNRKTETMEVIEKRLDRAKEELQYFKEYDYVVVNNSVDEAVRSIENIVDAESQRSDNYKQEIENIIKER